jgi:hypothetical protein
MVIELTTARVGNFAHGRVFWGTYVIEIEALRVLDQAGFEPTTLRAKDAKDSRGQPKRVKILGIYSSAYSPAG